MNLVKALEVSALPYQTAIAEGIARGDSDIQRFYHNSVVFLTGGSGFLGKQLVEKLLRSCNVSKIFLLLRSKKRKNIQERLDELLKDPVFETLRQQKPNFSEKIIVVEGDVAELRLGINNDDWKILTEEVDVIFHVAATTKFDETLRLATLINVRGTREALLLGRACKKLRSYVHVSTAYTHTTTTLIGEEVEEEFYPAPVPPEAIISMVENMEPDRLENITTELIKNWPNTYTFTKSIAEELVRTSSAGLPICIVRPGIVTCTYREPVYGWLDTSCVYGVSGLLLGLGLGVLHVVYANSKIGFGVVPCDYVNNAIVVAGRETATNQAKGGNDTRIYAVSSTHRNLLPWTLLKRVLRNEGSKLASPRAVNYIWGYETSSKSLFTILSILIHIIPAYFADFVCLFVGKQRRFVKLAKKAHRMSITLSYFSLNEWQILDNNLAKLYSGLSDRDKTIFNFDITDINWTEYVLLWGMGIRKYLVKDGLKNTEYGIKKQRCFKIVNYFILPLYFYGLWKVVFFVLCMGSSLLTYRAYKIKGRCLK